MLSLFSKVFKNKNLIPILIVLVFSLLAARHLVFARGYFIMHDDLQMMRQLEMEKCFIDGQIPCRWVPDMGYGFGFPLFNYYPPLPYLVGEMIRLLGFSFMETIKILFALSLIVSGFSMYFLVKEFFGRIGAVLASVFYVWAPYRSVDIFVRGAMNESWAFVFFPLIFLFSYRLINCSRLEISKNLIFLSLSLSALLLSHNIMVMIFMPFLLLWILLQIFIKNSWKRLTFLLISAVLAFGLSAFFVVPALLEQKLVQIQTLTKEYYDFRGHFTTLNQLFISRFWGYEGSYFGSENDGMSFQIGHLHWIGSLFLEILTILFLIFLATRYSHSFFQNIKRHKFTLILVFLGFMGWFSAFMTHSKSIFIWEKIPPLKFAQFPWRFLTLTTFAFSFSIGAITGVLTTLKTRFGILAKTIVTSIQLLVLFSLSILLVSLNWSYFRPKNGRLGLISDKEKFSGISWQLQQGGGVLDYLPKSVKVAPHASSGGLLDVIEGSVEIKNQEQGTYWVKFNASVLSDSAFVRINIFDFPIWRFYANGKQIEKFVPEFEETGRMHIKLEKGNFLVYGQLFNTPIRTIANLISIISFLTLFVYLSSAKKIKFGGKRIF